MIYKFFHSQGEYTKKIILCILLFFVIFSFSSCSIKKSSEPISTSCFKLNTYIQIKIYDSDNVSLLDGCKDIIDNYENIFSRTMETSEVYLLNNSDSLDITVSNDLRELIVFGIKYGALSKGRFDITIGSVSSLWDFTGGNIIPEETVLSNALNYVDYNSIKLDGNSLIRSSASTQLDLGGIAKGYIADKLKEYLIDNNVGSATISLGGNVLCIGCKPDGSDFKIGIQYPFGEYNETIAVLAIDDLSVVSSGSYERYFYSEGEFYHHILNPETGYPYDNDLISVTIISENSVDGDALSTSCFGLGLDDGMQLINSIENVYGIFITEDYSIYYSDGSRAFLISE